MNTTPSPATSSLPRSSDELDERRLQVIAEQAVGLRWQIFLIAIVVAAISWRDVPTGVVLVWFVGVVASREWRARVLVRMAGARQVPIADRLRSTVRWNLLLGACNGSAALFMAWLDPGLDAVLTMILVSWGAGAVSTSATVMRAFYAYASFLFVPTALMWMLTGTWLGWGVAALVLMFFGVQIRFARRNSETFEESFSMRLENQALARSLEAERSKLAVARDAAIKANLEKSRFLATASHDLRQPLQAMALNIDALLRLSMEREAQTVAGEIGASLEQLRSMLDGLLDLSKLDAGVVVAQPTRVRLDLLVASLAGSFRAAAVQRGLELRCVCPPELAVHTDPELLRRILANLLDNAIKFTPAGTVELRVAADGAQAEIAVVDSGPGIAAESHRLVFEDLVQLDLSNDKTRRGHGLGLGIVRRLAQLLQIPVGLESSRGAGATFRLSVPIARSDENAAQTDQPNWSILGRCVLVLDDDSMVRGAYVNALGGMGCRALAAATSNDALAQLQEATPDAAVVDYRLGDDTDGFAAIGRLREALPGLPVVMLTADTDPSIAAAAREHAVGLLRKPVDGPTLGRTLHAVMAGKLSWY